MAAAAGQEPGGGDQEVPLLQGLRVPEREGPLQRLQGHGEGEDDGGEAKMSWGGTCQVLESCRECQGTGTSATCGNYKITCDQCLGLGRVLVERCCVIGE